MNDLDRASPVRALTERAVSVHVGEEAKPDLGVLNVWRRPAPDFPVDVLGENWAPWVMRAAARASTPPSYVACGLLAFAAGVAGNGAVIEAWPGFTQSCCLWVANVGDPSARKSPALSSPRKALDRLEAECREQWETEHGKWKEEAARAREECAAWKSRARKAADGGDDPGPMPTVPEEPGCPRVKIVDTTVEAMTAVLNANPKGLLSVQDELASWLGFGRYSGSSAAERGIWLSAYDGGSLTVDRKKDGAITLDRLLVSVVGNLVPDRLGLVTDADDGLAARFLWCYPEAVPITRPAGGREEVNADIEFLYRAFGWLRNLGWDDGEPLLWRLDEPAAATFETWANAHDQSTRATTGFLSSAFGKGSGHVLRLALVLDLLNMPAAAMAENTIGQPRLETAVNLYESFFQPMARRVFGDGSTPDADRKAATLARWIASEGPGRKTINKRELYREIRLPGLTTAAHAGDALEALVEAGWLEPAGDRAGDSVGRMRGDYRVRGEVWQAIRSLS